MPSCDGKFVNSTDPLNICDHPHPCEEDCYLPLCANGIQRKLGIDGNYDCPPGFVVDRIHIMPFLRIESPSFLYPSRRFKVVNASPVPL